VPRSVDVGFMGNKVALRQVFLRFSHVSIVPTSLSMLFTPGG
jgi:hypothetical protein